MSKDPQIYLDIASYLEQNFYKLQERLHIHRGAEGANSEKIGMKLSGKRTVTFKILERSSPERESKGLTPNGKNPNLVKG